MNTRRAAVLASENSLIACECMYDPASGRCTQEDPIGLAGGINLYGYAGGDPVNFSDPFGLCPENMGGDGKHNTLGDCPVGSKGAAEFNRRAGGAIETAPVSPLDLLPIGGIAKGIHGVLTGGRQKQRKPH